MSAWNVEYQLLRKRHTNELNSYLFSPKDFPKYNQEWFKFVENRIKNIINIGGDYSNYDYPMEFEPIWKDRIISVMGKIWIKKKKYLSHFMKFIHNYVSLEELVSDVEKKAWKSFDRDSSSSSTSSSSSSSSSTSRASKNKKNERRNSRTPQKSVKRRKFSWLSSSSDTDSSDHSHRPEGRRKRSTTAKKRCSICRRNRSHSRSCSCKRKHNRSRRKEKSSSRSSSNSDKSSRSHKRRRKRDSCRCSRTISRGRSGSGPLSRKRSKSGSVSRSRSETTSRRYRDNRNRNISVSHKSKSMSVRSSCRRNSFSPSSSNIGTAHTKSRSLSKEKSEKLKTIPEISSEEIKVKELLNPSTSFTNREFCESTTLNSGNHKLTNFEGSDSKSNGERMSSSKEYLLHELPSLKSSGHNDSSNSPMSEMGKKVGTPERSGSNESFFQMGDKKVLNSDIEGPLIDILCQLVAYKVKLGDYYLIIDDIFLKLRNLMFSKEEKCISLTLDFILSLQLVQDKLRVICFSDSVKDVKGLEIVDAIENILKMIPVSKTVYPVSLYGLDMKDISVIIRNKSEEEAKLFINFILNYEGLIGITSKEVDEIYITCQQILEKDFSD